MKADAGERNQGGRQSFGRGRRLLGLVSSLALALSLAVPAGVILALVPSQPASADEFGAQGELPLYGLALLAGTAVDSAGNVYVASKQSNQVLKLTPGGTQTTLPFRGLDGPWALAVDAAGDVFVANVNSSQLLKLTPGGIQTTLPFSGLNTPGGIAVDATGNVFVSSLATNEVVKLTPGGIQTTLPFTGLDTPTGIAVDASGDVFVVNSGANSNVLELTPGGTQTTLPFTGLNAPEGVAVDAAGDVFVANALNHEVLELPSGGTEQTIGFSGLSVPVGVAVDAAGDVFVADFGTNKVLELPTGGTQQTLPFTGLDGLSGVAVDPAGNLFVANENGNQVLELTAGSVEKALPFAGLDHPSGVAVDAAGDVFVANRGSNQVFELTAGGTQTTLPFTGLNAPASVAVDAAGNVFVANRGTNQVVKLTPGGTQTTLAFTGLNAPYGVAVDAAGDVFVSSTGSNQVLKLTPAGTQTTLAFTGLNAPEGVGVDSYGNVFVANNGSNQVFELTAGGLQQTLGLVQLDGPAGLAVDSVGSVFVANYNSNTIMELPWVITNIYAAPSAVGSGTCNDAADACTLSTAVARATAFDCHGLSGCPRFTIYLTKAGNPADPNTHYVGNWDVTDILSTAGTPITFAAAPGLATPPILDGDANGVATLRISTGTFAVIDRVAFQNSSGAILNQGTLTVSDSTFTANLAGISGAGGAIKNENCVGPTLTVIDSTFTGNSAGLGGAISNGVGCSTGTGTVTVSGSTFTGNSAAEGGAISNGLQSAHGMLTVTDSTFTGNSTSLDNGGSGGAIDNGGFSGHGDAMVTNSTFTDNTAVNGAGGAIENKQPDGTLTVTGSTFTRNAANGDGGAIDSGSRTGDGALPVSGSTFTDNSTGGNGGAIDSGDRGTASHLTVSDSAFSGNAAAGDGGAIDNLDNNGRGPALTVSGSTFTGNRAGTYTGDGHLGNGGAVDNGDHSGNVVADTGAFGATASANSTATLTVSGSSFGGNSTTGDGGAIASGDHGGSATATALGTATSSFTANASNTVTNALTVLGSTFTGNSAGGGGGAVDNGGHGGSASATTATGVAYFTAIAANTTVNTMTVSGSTFADNSAADGGAVDNGDHGGSVTATGDGVRTATASNTNTLTLWNSTLTGNSAGEGGAIDNGAHGGTATAADTLRVWDSTFTANTAARGGVIDNGEAGSGTVYAAANIYNGSCLQGSGGSSWVDAGYNAGSDASCENGGTGDSAALTAAQLGPLGSHGGPTPTILPLSGPAMGIVPASTSVTLNGNSVVLCPTTDQRGVASLPGKCNAGAVQNNTVAVAPTVSVSHTANGSNGWNTTALVSVSVSGLGATSNLATLSCAVDGTPATMTPAFVAGSASYTGSVSVSGEGVHAIACNATDTAGSAAIQATDSVKLDAVKPTVNVSHTANGANGWNTTSPVTVNVTGLDATSKLATLSCTADGIPVALTPAFVAGSANYTGTVVVSGEGVHPVTCDATDTAGSAATQGTDTVKLNTAAPVLSVSHTANGSSGWNVNSPVSVSVSGLDATSKLATLSCAIDGTPTTLTPAVVAGSASYTGSVSVSAQGVRVVTCNATDTAGNAAIGTDSVKLDSVAPDTSILTHPATPTRSTGAPFTFTGSDATSNVASFECKLDAGGYAPCVSGKDFGAVAEGSHTLTVRAVDNAGNKDASPATFGWVVDLTEPNSAINTAGAGTPTNPTNATSATFTFSATDPVSGGVASGVNHLECKLDSAAFTTCKSTKTYSGIGLGAHTFQVRAVDNVGNVESTPDSFAWQVHAGTAIVYNGDQIVAVGNAFKPAGLLTSPTVGCVSTQPVTFSLDRNPTTGATGTSSLTSANTNASGQATASSISTTGWLEGVYDITASYAGSASCDAASYTASLTVGSSGSAAIGGGWYTTSATGRINFGFAVFKTPNTNPAQYKGQAVIQNNGKWRLRGTLNSYLKVGTQGTASGVGDLYWWDATLNRGFGGWRLAKSGVAFTLTFTDVRTGTNPTDTMGVNIKYTPVRPQPSTMPNSSPQPLKFGFVSVL